MHNLHVSKSHNMPNVEICVKLEVVKCVKQYANGRGSLRYFHREFCFKVSNPRESHSLQGVFHLSFKLSYLIYHKLN